ncbi:MAG: ABC transporter ATP-binding protein [Vicinamibacterales bacterium]
MQFTCHRLSKIYRNLNATIEAVHDVSFRVEEGEFVCVIGSSGCGKTTLVKLIAGLLKPTSGYVHFDREPDTGRPRTALVFQEHGLFPWMTVVDNVAFGLQMAGVERKARRERAAAFLTRVGLGSCLDNYPHELSAGMRQRVNIARAFLVDPHTLLMDEPFASLDALTKLALQEELVRMWADRRGSVVYVTHDIEEAVLLGDRVLVMSGGRGDSGRICEEIPIPLPRPRNLVARHQPEIRDLTWHIWSILENEVRQRLSIPS